MEFQKQFTKAKLWRYYLKGRVRILPKEHKLMSKKYTLNSIDGGKIIKVILYSGVSAAILAAINILPQIEFSTNWIWLLPVINALLVLAKKFFSGEKFAGEEKPE